MIPHPRPARRLAALLVGACTAGAIVLGGAQGATAAGATSFPDAKPSWAKVGNARGAADAAKTVEGEVGFSLRDAAQAEQLAQAVSTPGSPLYRKYVGSNRWIARFSPSKSDFTLVLDYLRDAGLTVTGTPKSRLFITFRGTVAQLEKAFGTDLRRYAYRGHVLVAPAVTPTLPDRVARSVNGVYLGTARTVTRPTAAAAPKADGPTQVSLPGVPCSRYWQQHTATLPEAYGRTEFPTANCGYLGRQFRSAYEIPRSMTGAGQTVAILDAYGSPSLVRDYRTFAKKHGGTPLTSATYRQIVPKRFYDADLCGGIGGWQGEQVLDVTAVHGIAPKARMQYVGGFNCGTGLDVAMSQVLDDRLATIVTNSYGSDGEPPAAAVAVNQNQQLQAAAEGIGLYFSTGDLGDNSTLENAADIGAPTADYFATSPYVTGVGGTTTEIGRNGRTALETGWGNHYDAVVKDPATGSIGYEADPPGDFQSGAGGGISRVFAQPWYQAGVVDAAGRGVPDVAAVGDPRTGELIGYRAYDDESGKLTKYDEAIYGGTSLSTPLFAAEVALLQQRTHHVYGFLNPLLYGAVAAGRSPFTDVVSQDVAVAYNDQFDGHTSLVTGNLDTSLTTAPGWDDVTGLGVLRLRKVPAALR